MSENEKKPSLWERIRRGIHLEIKSAGKLVGILNHFFILPSQKSISDDVPDEVKYLAVSNAFEGYIGNRRIGGGW